MSRFLLVTLLVTASFGAILYFAFWQDRRQQRRQRQAENRRLDEDAKHR